MHMRVRLAAYVCVYVRCRYAPNVHVLPALKQRWGKDQPTPAESMPDNLSTLTVAVLKKELKARMLPVSGVKTELVNRLQDSLDGVERPKRKRRTMSFSPFDGNDHQSRYKSDSSSGDDYGPILPLSMPPVPAKLGVRVVKSGQPLSWAQRQHMFDRPAKHAKQHHAAAADATATRGPAGGGVQATCRCGTLAAKACRTSCCGSCCQGSCSRHKK